MQQREARTQVNNSSVSLEKKSADKKTENYKVLNISRGGLCFECAMGQFELNEIVNLNLRINETTVHQANGRVCYCNQNHCDPTTQYGLSFLDKFIDMNELPK